MRPLVSPALLVSVLLLACSDGVDPSRPQAIVITPETPRVVTGATAQLEAKVVDGTGQEIPGLGIEFESRLPDFITVSETGLLRAVGEYGASTITARWGWLTAEVWAEIVPPPSVLLVKPESLELAAGESRDLLAWYIDENSEEVWTAKFLFEVSDPAVARAEPEGYVARVTGETAGTATITVTSGERSVQIPVTVTEAEIR